MPETETSLTVLAVDDDEEILETYELWLFDVCDLLTATDGSSALDVLDGHSADVDADADADAGADADADADADVDADVDVVLLDRMMSGLSGRDVLERVRERDGEYAVVMVTAVDPDLDVVEMDCDAYLPKPMSQADLVDTIESVCRRRDLPPDVREYFRLRSIRRTLEASKDRGKLEQRDEYDRLCDRIDELEASIGDELDDLADGADAYL